MPSMYLARLGGRLRPAAPRLFALKALIWLVAALFVVVGAQLAGVGFHAGPGAAPSLSVPAVGLRSSAASLASGAQAGGSASTNYGPIVQATCSGGGGCEYGPGVVYKNGQFYASKANIDNLSKAIGLLPAWRWGSSLQLYSNSGIGGWLFNAISADILPAVASVCFVFASWIWQLMLAVIAWGLSSDVIGALGGSINAAFKGLEQNITGAGLWAIIGFGVLLVAIKSLLRGQVSKVLTLVLTFAIPTAAMWALATQIDNNPGGGASAAGTPAWIAATGTNLLQTTSAELTRPISALSGGAVGASGIAQEANAATPNCAQYDAALYGYYNSLASQSGAGTGMAALDDISYLWQSALETDWESAQFGSTTGGSRIVCHQLERNANISAQEQQAIAEVAYGSAPNVNVFVTSPSQKTAEAQMFFWDACTGSGSALTAVPGWASPTGATSGAGTGGGLANSDCSNWWSSGHVNGKLEWSTLGDLQNATLSATNVSHQAQQQLASVYSTASSYWGANGPQRALEGFFALLVALVYLWSLGGLALGCVIAEIGCVLMFVLLPVTLTALSAGALTGGESRLGKKMLKLTGGFMASKLIFNVVLFALLQIIYLAQALLNSNGSGLSGIMQALIPIAALLILRKLLSYLGLGDITKVSGAVGLASAAAVKATGDKKMLAATHAGVARAGGRAGDLSAGSVARSFGRASARLGRFGARKFDQKTDLSNRLNLAARKTQLLGRTDRDGNVTERGLAQQVAWFGALVDAGRRTKYLAPLLTSSAEQQAGMAAQRARYEKSARESIVAERAARREWISQTQGMSSRERIQATGQRLAARTDLLKTSGAQFNRLEMSGPDGKPMTVALPKLAEGLFYSDQELAGIMNHAAGQFGVEEDRVIGSHLGLATLEMPHQARPDGTGRTVAATRKRDAAAAMQHSKDVLNYMDWDLVRRRDNESMDAWNYRLNHYRLAAGGLDENGIPTDFLQANGIDLSTADGRAMWAADQRGERTPIVSLRAVLASDVVADIDRQAARIDVVGRFTGGGFDAGAREQAVRAKVAEVHQASVATEATRARVDGSGNAIIRSIVEFQQNETKLPELRQRLGNAEGTLASVQNEVARRQETLAHLKADAARAGAQVAEFDDRLRSAAAGAAAQLRRQLAEAQSQAQQRAVEVAKVEELLPQLEARLVAAAETRDGLKTQVERISSEMETSPSRLQDLRGGLFSAARSVVAQAAAAETEATTLKFYAEVQRGERSFDAIQYDAVEAEKAIAKKVKQAEDALARYENAIIQGDNSDTVKQAVGELQRFAGGLARSATDMVGAEMGRTAKEWKTSEAIREALAARYSAPAGPRTAEDLWGKQALERVRFPS